MVWKKDGAHNYGQNHYKKENKSSKIGQNGKNYTYVADKVLTAINRILFSKN